MEKPLVSIRCTVYNHEPYLRQCLDGFVMQKTNFPFEAIVHDDASTDHSADIIREYASKYPNIIKPIYETENQYSKHDGSLARIMDEACTGKYIAFCEGDDYWTNPNKLQMQFDAMESHPECTICFSKVQMVNKFGKSIGVTIPYKHLVKEGFVGIRTLTHTEFFLGHWCFHTSSFFIRADMIGKTRVMQKGHLKDFPYGDMPLEMTSLFYGKGFFINELTGCYRLDSGGYNSTMKKNPKLREKNSYKVYLAYKAFDKMTDYKYHDDINIWCLRYEYNIESRENGFEVIIADKYKDLRKTFAFKKKFKIYILKKLPRVYYPLRNLKHKLKSLK